MKTKLLFIVAALLGAAAIIWMGAGFVGANPLALLVTALIGFVYALGLVELVQFRQATANLAGALGDVHEGESFSLPSWLGQLHASLQNAVAQRIEGEKVGLPAPVFAPYLVGLLVMLGLLGTFVGMVDTLQGAVGALQGSTELEAIRNGLAAPIEGLGLAFGTSVAGVAASAMLGLNATLSRRERILVTRELDRLTSGPLRCYSLHYNRQQTFQALQAQAHALPDVAEKLTVMAGELERMGQQLTEQLTTNQQQFHQAAEQQYRDLAQSVDQSLRDSLAASGRLAGESIAPVVTDAMKQLSAVSAETHEKILTSTETMQRERADKESDWLAQQGQRMEALTAALREDLTQMSGALRSELGGLRKEENDSRLETARRLAGIQSATAEGINALNSNAAAALGEIQTTTAAQLAALQTGTGEQMSKLYGDTSGSLAAIRQDTEAQLADLRSNTAQMLAQSHTDTARTLEELQASASRHFDTLQDSTGSHLESLQASSAQGLQELHSAATASLEQLNASVTESIAQLETNTSEQLSKLQATAAEQLAGLGRELQEPMKELIHTASETPKAAAEVIGKLREQVSGNLERDNHMLEERQKILEELGSLSTAMQQSTAQQHAAIESLVADTGATLKDVSKHFQQQLTAEAGKLSEITANAAGSAADIASLGDSFSLAVQLFSDSNTQLVENLCRIEESMEKSSERSDEQMSYYVAQAREIIDQSMLSQREIIEELRRLGQTGDLFAAEATS
ncbi:hypothetical protein [Pseudohalioglobus lutimaris]|uniref:DUF802 domain-containing protein n=1 Tax=Pseudohalioglobus lutimaris TaxID=1737061 RepID=A0A2N5X644_9GAMM|nr:hypothetical protein [Pseudohalioglobus lutimaris]PLW69963.1 hypothetical protein C0039_05445 [Pseudohalioglobus lutimaris]